MFSLSFIVIRVFTYFILGLPLDGKCVGELLLRKHKAATHGTDWRNGPHPQCLGVFGEGRNGGFNLHCATVVLLIDCSLACSLRKEIPSGALKPSLERLWRNSALTFDH